MTFTIKRWKHNPEEAKLRKCFLFQPSGRVSLPRLLLLTGLLCNHFESEGVLVQTPTNATVIANHSTFFNCSKSLNESGELTWFHYPLDGKGTDVYEDGKIRGKYKGRFDIETNNFTYGIYNLLIQNPEPKDAGRYDCVEDRLTKDKRASAELTVLESNLVCKSDKDLNEIVGPTQCDKPIARDQLLLSCSVTYSGNFPPQMQWKKVDSELQLNETKCDFRGNRVMCNVTLEVNHNMDGSIYICQIITAEQYNCSLKVNKTIYIFSDTSVTAITTTQKANCSANTSLNLNCLYNWYKDDQIKQTGATLKTSNPGLYRCKAECKIRNETCAFNATIVNASEPGDNKAGPIAVSIASVVVVAGIVIAIAIVLYKKRQNKQDSREETKEMTRIEDTTDGNEETSPLPIITNQVPDSLDGIDSEQSTEIVNQEFFNERCFIGNGLLGLIYGPGLYEGKPCACEKTMVSASKADIIQRRGLEWMKFDHDNLIKFYGIVDRPPAIFIIMEYARGGSVRDALKECVKSNINLQISVVKNWAIQIANGMNYLHEKKIVHKHLNSAQVLIMESFQESDNWNYTLKISQYLLIDDGHMSSHAKKDVFFTAPEAFKGIYTSQGDVWSYGVTVLKILTREIQNKGCTDAAVANGIREGTLIVQIPDSCPPALRGVLEGCFEWKPEGRPSFSVILSSLA